ncbi:unnamed protein product [Durusdinium trenchii]|uniref:Secreted protein n=1 Tax=Durusdinium trenchii TaxID=1381693 RepID=A0ABP0RMJ4_9DINO
MVLGASSLGFAVASGSVSDWWREVVTLRVRGLLHDSGSERCGEKRHCRLLARSRLGYRGFFRLYRMRLLWRAAGVGRCSLPLISVLLPCGAFLWTFCSRLDAM